MRPASMQSVRSPLLIMLREDSSSPEYLGTYLFFSTGLDHSLHMVRLVSTLIQSSSHPSAIVSNMMRSSMAHRTFFSSHFRVVHRQNCGGQAPSSKALPRKTCNSRRRQPAL